MKKVKASMKEQVYRRDVMRQKHEFLTTEADKVADISLKNLYRGDARILRNEIDHITCYLDTCTKTLTKEGGPTPEELVNLRNFKYWQD
jgi:hypothetical protein